MGLKIPFGEMLEYYWRWACRCHPRMFVVNHKNKHQNGVRIWNVSELYLSLNLNKRHNDFRVWSVSELYLNCILKLSLNGRQNGFHV